MDLEHDEVTLLLSDGQDDAVDSTDKKIVPVPICISVSAYGNVEALHERRKQIFQKEKRTELATQAALNKAQAKMTKQQVSVRFYQDVFECALQCALLRSLSRGIVEAWCRKNQGPSAVGTCAYTKAFLV